MKLMLISTLTAILLLVPASLALITCDDCKTENCTCYIQDCGSGLVDVFDTRDCSGTPSHEFTFTNDNLIWSPAKAQTYYLMAFCDDATTKSECNSVTAKQLTTTTTTTPSTTTTTTTTITIYGPREENTFDIALRIVAILLTISFVFIFFYSRV